jgi:hypothetical protein
LPTSAGGSYYGQPSKGLGDLYKYYEQQKQQVAGTTQQQQTQPTPQTQPTAKQPSGLPNINIFVSGGGKQPEQKNIFQQFLEKFSRGVKARQQSSLLDNPMEMAQQITNVPRVDYFS